MQFVHVILLFASLSFFLFGFFQIGLRKRSRPVSLALFATGAVYLVYTLFYFGAYYFTGNGIDYSVVYHVIFGLHGAGYAEYKVLIFSVFATLLLGLVFLYAIVRKGGTRGQTTLSVLLFSSLSLLVSGCLHPASVDIFKLRYQKAENDFWNYYRTPRIIRSDGKPRNMVFIYAESFERTYFNSDTYPGLVTHLKKLESDAVSFTNIGSFPHTGWTIAGMVASQCGIPLVALSHGNSMAGMDLFLSDAVCLGDLLAEEDFSLSFMGGASLDFAGKGSFYRTHGFQKVAGKEELVPRLPDSSYVTGWGLYDDSLLTLAFDEFENLSKKKEPFGLFLITLDTHGSDHYSKSCEGIVNEGKAQANIACTDYLLFDFINKIRGSPYGDNTLIVVASDHLTMRGSARLRENKRSNMFFIIDPDKQKGERINKKGSPLDIGPTVLYALGYKARLGLGRNLFKDTPSIVDELIHPGKSVNGWKEQLLSFWSFPVIEKQIVIDGKRDTVKVDDRELQIPLLIQYDSSLKTTIMFEIYNDALHKTLADHLRKLSQQDSFLLVDKCSKINNWLPGDYQKGLCYVNGMLGSDALSVERAKGMITLSVDELKKTMKQPTDTQLFEERLSMLAEKK